MKWLLLGILISIILSRKYLVGDLFRAVRAAPKQFKDGARGLDDPVKTAKSITDDQTRSGPDR